MVKNNRDIQIPERFNIIHCEYSYIPDNKEKEYAVFTNNCLIHYAYNKQKYNKTT